MFAVGSCVCSDGQKSVMALSPLSSPRSAGSDGHGEFSSSSATQMPKRESEPAPDISSSPLRQPEIFMMQYATARAMQACGFV